MLKHAFLSVLVLFIGSAAASAEPSEFADTWTGVLQPTPTQSLTLVLKVVDGENGLTATLDSPDQGAMGLPASELVITGDDIEVAFTFGAAFRGTLDRGPDPDEIRGQFLQSGLAFDLTFVRGTAVPEVETDALNRPQEPTAPLPYDTVDVRIPVEGTDVVLAGTLTEPTTKKRRSPAVILLTGSGPQDRDEYIELAGHRTFLVLSDYLTRQGITVLRYDDRGFAESTGTYEGSTIHDFGKDAAAALAFLKERHRGPIGFIGHSEGGWTAINAVSNHGAKPDFIVGLGSPFVPLPDVVARQAVDLMRANGLNEVQLSQIAIMQGQLMKALKSGKTEEEMCAAVTKAAQGYPPQIQAQAQQLCTPWMFSMATFDVAAAYEAYRKPVLALFGGLDLQVAAEPSAPVAEEVLSHRKSKVMTIEGANHLFQSANTGSMTEYVTIDETFRPDVMQLIVDWIMKDAT